jgi:hypothetical protein
LAEIERTYAMVLLLPRMKVKPGEKFSSFPVSIWGSALELKLVYPRVWPWHSLAAVAAEGVVDCINHE